MLLPGRALPELRVDLLDANEADVCLQCRRSPAILAWLYRRKAFAVRVPTCHDLPIHRRQLTRRKSHAAREEVTNVLLTAVKRLLLNLAEHNTFSWMGVRWRDKLAADDVGLAPVVALRKHLRHVPCDLHAARCPHCEDDRQKQADHTARPLERKEELLYVLGEQVLELRHPPNWPLLLPVRQDRLERDRGVAHLADALGDRSADAAVQLHAAGVEGEPIVEDQHRWEAKEEQAVRPHDAETHEEAKLTERLQDRSQVREEGGCSCQGSGQASHTSLFVHVTDALFLILPFLHGLPESDEDDDDISTKPGDEEKGQEVGPCDSIRARQHPGHDEGHWN
mmetsp:Transcript_9388/g.23378  ORF Transcript_9388/g.23378 Transcript_9388/m.23378 type:complete len:338 (-) Transcript_9388:2116-3129(-)